MSPSRLKPAEAQRIRAHLHMTDQDHAVERAKADYVSDKIDQEGLEGAVAAILDGTDRWYTSPFEPFEVERR